MLIGQDSLINSINSYSLNNLPNPIFLIGEEGCGKKTLIQYISSYFNLEYIDITNQIEPEDLNKYLLYPTPIFYIINLNKINYKQQNKLLKFIEEPSLSTNIHLIIYMNSENNAINTILNRGIKFYFKPYFKEQLMPFLKEDNQEDLLFNIYNTPGKIMHFNNKEWEETKKLSSLFIEKLSIASFPNTLSLIDKFNLKEENNKLNVESFLYLNSFNLKNKYNNLKENLLYEWFILSNKYINYFKNNIYNKEHLLYNYLIDSWLLVNK